MLKLYSRTALISDDDCASILLYLLFLVNTCSCLVSVGLSSLFLCSIFHYIQDFFICRISSCKYNKNFTCYSIFNLIMQEDRPKENINTTDKRFLSLVKQELDIILVSLIVIEYSFEVLFKYEKSLVILNFCFEFYY